MNSLRINISSTLICIVSISLFSCVPANTYAQQSNPGNIGFSVVPFIGVGTAFGGMEASYSPIDYPDYSDNTRKWSFYPGYNFTAKLLLWQSRFTGSEPSRFTVLGLLCGIDLCLVPRGVDRYKDTEGVHSGNGRLKENLFYIAPSLVIRPKKVPFQFLLAVGVNRRIWDGSNIEGIDLKNSHGTSVIALMRYHSFWTGISIHHGLSDTIVVDNFSERFRTQVAIASTSVWFNIGVNGWNL